MAVPTTDELRSLAETLKAEGLVSEFLALLSDEAPKVFRTTEHVAGNIYVRPMVFEKAGHRVVGHRHNYAHVTLVVRGSVVARGWDGDAEGKPVGPVTERTFKAPSDIQIPAGRYHEFVALEDGTLARCYFAHRDYDGEVVQNYLGNLEATR